MINSKLSKAGVSNTPIKLRGGSFALLMAHLHEAGPEVIRRALEDKIAQAPAFLRHAPVVVNVSGLESPVNWLALQEVIASTGLRIIDISGCKSARLKAEIDETDLPLLTEDKKKAIRPVSVEAPAPVAPLQNITPIMKARLINMPVRSGQRIYAPQRDLVVTSHVSVGAELIVDGDIHVYGMMKDRTLAGTSDDREV